MVEDVEADAYLLAWELKRSGYDLIYERVDTPEAMRSALEQQNWDVITSDHVMPRFNAPSALALAQELAPNTPFIIVSGEIDLNLAVTLLKAGAHDYIQKSEIARVPPAIDRELAEMEQHRQRRRAEEELRLSEEKFTKAFQNSPDSININRLADGVYLAVNEGFERMSGYCADEAIGKSSTEINIWVDQGERGQLILELMEKGSLDQTERIVRTKDGTLKNCLTSARLITINGEPCIIASSRDMTLQKKAEQTIRRRNRELLAINQIASAVTTQLDPSILLDIALRGALELTGLESGAIYLFESNAQSHLAAAQNFAPSQAKNTLPFLASEQIQRGLAKLAGIFNYQIFQSALPGDCGPFQATFPLILQRNIIGAMYLWAEAAEPVQADTMELVQNLCGTLALALNNARLYETVQQHAVELEQHVNERTAQLTTLNQELKAFSYSAAHDLRSPLHAISGFSQILLDEQRERLDDDGKLLLSRVLENVQRMQEMLDALLALSRLSQSTLHQEVVDLSALTASIAAEIHQNEPQRCVDWHIQEGLIVQGDRSLLYTMLENLLSNAWKFTAPYPDAFIELGSLADASAPNSTIYYVRDNGAGFDMSQANQLFQVFQRLHTESEFPGHGVGLASVERIIQRHGGRIWAEGSPGKGATFYFTLA